MALRTGLLQGPRRGLFLMSEVPLYRTRSVSTVKILVTSPIQA
jgi:hypothetical protein